MILSIYNVYIAEHIKYNKARPDLDLPKILLDFLFYLKYNNLKVSGNNKLNSKEAKNDIFKLSIFSM